THADNSFLVGYRLRAVGRGCEPYDESCVWADPSPDEAVEHMRTVAWRQDTRNRTARNGQEYVQQFLSRKAVGARMANRLAILRRQPSGRGRRATRDEGFEDDELGAG